MPVLYSAPRRSERQAWRVWDCSGAGPSTLPSFSALLRKLRLEGIVCKRLDTALGKDAVAEVQPIRDR
jgi:hypothetical protein